MIVVEGGVGHKQFLRVTDRKVIITLLLDIKLKLRIPFLQFLKPSSFGRIRICVDTGAILY